MTLLNFKYVLLSKYENVSIYPPITHTQNEKSIRYNHRISQVGYYHLELVKFRITDILVEIIKVFRYYYK